jgi:hypothetical protein
VLRDIYKKELMEYKFELESKTNKQDKLLLKNWDTNYNSEYAAKLLSLYLDRCKFRHALAFIQFRKILPDAKLSDLRDIFIDRK